MYRKPAPVEDLTLGDIVTNHWGGYSFRSDDYSDTGIPVLTKGDVKPRGVVEHGGRFISEDKLTDRRIKLTTARDFLITTRDLTTAADFLGLVARAPRRSQFAVNQGVTVFQIDDRKVDSRYLSYWCEGPLFRGHIKGHYAGATQIHIRHADVMSAPVRAPPIETQRRIACILSTYDDLIENNTRRIAILKEIARRIYEEWFVRFRFPGHENVRMVESELGPVPAGWTLRKLGDEIELAYGKALKAEERVPGEVPVFGSSGIVGSHNQRLVDGPGIIVGRKGNVGSVHWSDSAFYPIDTVYYIRTKLPPHFLFFNLQRQNFLNNDAAVPGLNRKQAYALPLLLPASRELQRFEENCQSILGLARALERKNQNLRSTRDLLLPKLISGQLDVSSLPEPEAAVA